MIKYVDGDLIQLALDRNFDVIGHGCNCFCTMGAGIAPQMARAFWCNDPTKYPWEGDEHKGDYRKLGTSRNTHGTSQVLIVTSWTC